MRTGQSPTFLYNCASGNNLGEEMRHLRRQFLGVFVGQIAAGRQGLVEHLEYLDPLRVLKMEKDILADDQAVILAGRLKRQQIVVLKSQSCRGGSV